MSRPRERSAVERERGSVPLVQGETGPIGSEGGPTLEGRERAERYSDLEAPLPDLPPLPAGPPPDPEPLETFAAGTCRVCQLGVVVRVRHNSARRGAPDIRAYCLFCHRSLDPHEVEPFPGG